MKIGGLLFCGNWMNLKIMLKFDKGTCWRNLEKNDRKDEWLGFWSLMKFESIRKILCSRRSVDSMRWIYEDEEVSFSVEIGGEMKRVNCESVWAFEVILKMKFWDFIRKCIIFDRRRKMEWWMIEWRSY